MNTTSDAPQVEAAEAVKASRVAKLIRWAARLTSLPVFAMLMISLLPAIANFSLSPREDKILALALCGIGLGFGLGWRWPGWGGVLSLLSVGVVLKQSDVSVFADPFSIAFALQGLLFLISAILNTRPSERAAAPVVWAKRTAGAVLVLAAIGGVAVILRGPGPTPIGKSKEAFVGVWESGAGFSIEITADGRAKVTEDKGASVQPCNTPVQPGETREFMAEFRADDVLELSSGTLGPSKIYHVDRRPFPQRQQVRMVLNGSDPYVRTNGLILIKRQATAQKALVPPVKKS